MKAVRIKVTGLVQGVGFRPFIYLLAQRFQVYGTVENNNEGVLIFAEQESVVLLNFLDAIRREAPPASFIKEMDYSEVPFYGFNDFSIIKSSSISSAITEVSPDIAVCDACLLDLKSQNHRLGYPFINCTHCGPRFTIIRDLPYDRAQTSMHEFEMCQQCLHEYQDVLDRRFHAQPIACLHCGPFYELEVKSEVIIHFDHIIKALTTLILQGGIVAMKGMGGFHLACDATNPRAVSRLRDLKNREGKPFAVLFRDLEQIKAEAILNEQEKMSLTSWRRPIALVALRGDRTISDEVTNGLSTIGAMLPYLPLHHLLFEESSLPPIVLTSGNESNEPIVIDNEVAQRIWRGKVDAILTYNRTIENRTDDSVVRILLGQELVFRRSRGFVPSPVQLRLDTEGIVATGAELVNCFCIGKGKSAILSQHIGDLKNVETLDFYQESLSKLLHLFRVEPLLIVSDLHPDYFSTKIAENSEWNVAHIKVQHHHAHIASCMAENGIDEQVIGVAMDGTGLGDDGTIWGAEFFICDLMTYRRVSHFEYLPLPGGDRAVEEPWRMAISYLYHVYGDAFVELNIPFLKNPEKKENWSEGIAAIIKMMTNQINSPLVSSAGRLFDAVAAILGICTHTSFSAEAPMRLESVIRENVKETYTFQTIHENQISFQPMIREIVTDLETGIDSGIISAKFHNTLISAIFEKIVSISSQTELRKVALSGGTFQNRYLVENLQPKLVDAGFEVYLHRSVPPNDGGLALGQLAIAAKRREIKCV